MSITPLEGAAIAVHALGQTFFATNTDHDVAIIVGRAKVWASENNIAKVYVRRDRH